MTQRLSNRAPAAADAPEWIEVGKLDDIPRLGARVVRTARGDIAVFRTLDDDVFALDDRCPHKGGPLSQGIVYGRKVACPLHNWSIHLDTGEAVAPDEGCTARYPVRLDAGRIYLALQPQGNDTPCGARSTLAT
ncbi:MAG: nitrite reductase small subunit NirD [Gammaproteobacteria bacterium]